MANPYFTHTDKHNPGTLARGNEVDADLNSVEAGFDALYVDVKRAIKMPTSITTDQVLPSLASARANRFIGFDNSGDLTVGTPTAISSPVITVADAYKIARVDSLGAAWEFEDGLLHSPTNVLFAPGAGAALTGVDNTLIGPGAGSGLTTGARNVVIGHDAGNWLTTESDKLVIANSNTATPLIYGDFAAGRVGIGRAPTTYQWEVEGDAWIRGGLVLAGLSDTTAGIFLAYGGPAASNQGGQLRFYTAADHDTTIDYWRLDAYTDDARLFPSDSSFTHWFRNDGSVELANTLKVGANDTTNGSLYLYGDSTTNGGELRIYNSAGEDTIVEYWQLRANASLEFIHDGTVAGYIYTGGGLWWPAGDIRIGQNDTTLGALYIYGNNGANGGIIYLYNGATNGTNADFWYVQPSDTTLTLKHSGAAGTTASVAVGTTDSIAGALYLYGNNATASGELRLYNGATNDTTVDYLQLAPVNTTAGNILALTSDAGSPIFAVGVEDTTKGVLSLYGDTGSSGGTLRLYNGATADTTTDYFALTPTDDLLYLTGSGATVDIALVIGSSDAAAGALYLSGDNAATGGSLRLYNGATNDTTVDYLQLAPVNTTAGNILALTSNAGSPVLAVGVDDTTQGSLYLYGDSGANAGEIRLYNGATSDPVVEYFTISNYYNELRITSDAGGQWSFNYSSPTSGLYLGIVDSVPGELLIYGGSTTTGGKLRLYNGASNDITVDYWSILANDRLEFNAAAATKLYLENDYGLVLGSPTGGSQGAGTFNTENGLYRQGNKVDEWEYLNGGTISSATNAIEDATAFSSTYKRYKLILYYIIPTTDGTQLYMQVTDDSGVTFENTAYCWHLHGWALGAANSEQGNAADTAIWLAPGTSGSATGEEFVGEITFIDPAQSSYKAMIHWWARYNNTVGTHIIVDPGAAHRTTYTAWTGFRIWFGTYATNTIAAAKWELWGTRAGA